MSGSLESLLRDAQERKARLAVIGLGYVGLPLAVLLAEAGFSVTGVDINAERVRRINAGVNPIEGIEPGLDDLVAVVAGSKLEATTDAQRLASAQAVFICVETPVESDHRPRFDALTSACRSLGAVMSPGALVVVESTLAPGTIDRVVRPTLEQTSGLRSGVDFHIGHCPERVMPGRLLRNMRTMARVMGGDSPLTSEVMRAIYGTFVGGDLDAADILTAELVKSAENSYRDLNIAFANELALICEAVGGDVWAVRELVNKSPGRNVLLPGGGVGGHCLPKDPWLLASPLPQRDTTLVAAARRVNDGMPRHVAELVFDVMAEAGTQASGARVAVLGFAYLEDSDDVRNSPTADLVAHLEQAGANVAVHDPFVAGFAGDVYETALGADCVVLMVGHSEYRSLDLARITRGCRTPCLVDARAFFEPGELAGANIRVRRLGVGRDLPLR